MRREAKYLQAGTRTPHRDQFAVTCAFSDCDRNACWNGDAGKSVSAMDSSGSRSYVQAGNVSHGYAFFAPDPGPGHIIEYELRFDDGRKERGTIPDSNQHWPRLRYHRHFMLTEQLASLWEDEPPRPENPRFAMAWQQDHQRWERQRNEFTRRANSYGRQLLQRSGASAVEMNLMRHHLLTPEEFLSGRSLRERELYETGEIITVHAGGQP